MTDRPITQLFAVLVDWSVARGLTNASQMTENWAAETADYCVTLNGSLTEERDDVPPLTFRLVHKTRMLGVAFVNPFEGTVAGCTEEELIQHFGMPA